MTQPGRPAVFVHGLWLHASSWEPWLELFKEAGYAPIAPGWPGELDTVEDSRRDPDQVAGKGINDVVNHYARIIRGLEAPPVVIGHSFGGLIAQRLLGQDLAATAVAIDAAPIKGVLNLPASALKVASIALRKPANRNLAISLTAEQFRYGFGNALPGQESAELYDRWTVPSPARPLFEAALANFTPQSPAKVNTGNKTRGPLLLVAGGNDHTVPAAITTSTRRLYHKSPAVTDLIEFLDRGHSLTIDHGWREVAQAALDWLKQRSALSAGCENPSAGLDGDPGFDVPGRSRGQAPPANQAGSGSGPSRRRRRPGAGDEAGGEDRRQLRLRAVAVLVHECRQLVVVPGPQGLDHGHVLREHFLPAVR
jgi:pimeloyl-ACP methyl ester carboxylesterase